jgi:pimeloyl-ACP methyl ester carboxylesterase
VAAHLNELGHHVVAADQRGHGLSDKPETGYGFDEVTADVHALIEALDLSRPVVAGQSWGGNVVLDFAARYPEDPAGIVLVDGGFIDLSSAPGMTWERVQVDLRPPPLAGTPRPVMLERMRNFHPEWDEEQVEMQMANFETLADGTVRPWLTLDRHMQILRALWDQKPSSLYGRVKAPTMIAVADSPSPERAARKQLEVGRAADELANASVRIFEGAHHDVHVDKSRDLADWLLEALDGGFFG